MCQENFVANAFAHSSAPLYALSSSRVVWSFIPNIRCEKALSPRFLLLAPWDQLEPQWWLNRVHPHPAIFTQPPAGFAHK